MVSVGAIALNTWFLQKERLARIDQQVRETATALINSERGEIRRIDFEQAEKVIAQELGENRLRKFFIVRNELGEVIFKSSISHLLKIQEVPLSPMWITIRENGQYIRVLNLLLPSIYDRTLQVGIAIDETLVAKSFITERSLFFIISMLAIGSIVAWLLTSLLLAPIRKLDKFVSLVIQRLQSRKELPKMSADLLASARSSKEDEFHRLTAGFSSMLQSLDRSQKSSRLWAYQMAHEIKTPLTHIEIELECGLREKRIQQDSAKAISKEVASVSDTVNSFLGWAELENSNQQKHLFANKIGKSVREVISRLERHYGSRIQVEVKKDFSAPCSPSHLEQLIFNITTNALKYSPANSPIKIVIDQNELCISDQGPGLPSQVIEHLGEPFNRGASPIVQSGQGLGLAWVNSLARLYDWKISFLSSNQGTKVTVNFPDLENRIKNTPENCLVENFATN